MEGHRYTVEFRIYGKDLDLVEITRDLELLPIRTVAAGSRMGSRVREKAMWGFNGGGDAEEIDWPSLEDGLTFLLDRLEPKIVLLEKLRPNNQFIWWCGHFQSSFDGGPSLSPRLLRRLGEFGVEIFIDCYFEDEGDAEVGSEKR